VTFEEKLPELKEKIVKLAQAGYGRVDGTPLDPPEIVERGRITQSRRSYSTPVEVVSTPDIYLHLNVNFEVEHKTSSNGPNPHQGLLLHLKTNGSINTLGSISGEANGQITEYLSKRSGNLLRALAENAGLQYGGEAQRNGSNDYLSHIPEAGTFLLHTVATSPDQQSRTYHSYLVINAQDADRFITAAKGLRSDRFKQAPIGPRDKRPPSPPAISA